MSTHRHIDRICTVVVAICVVLAMLFSMGESIGIEAAASSLGYEDRLFDTSVVHTIEITMENWDEFIASCEDEEYETCTITIDGETYANVAIRAKGNTSLTSVSSMDSDRYSFKVEFDHYDSSGSYYGLDKLNLNNLIQDTTYMKDYLTYRLMGEFGVAAPLCSYAYITVNGEDWGLYLAVEGVEGSFLQRNYGNDYGELYKPDSMSFGAGRGNGRDFDMDEFMNEFSGEEASDSSTADSTAASEMPDMSGFDPSSLPEDAGEFTGGGGMDFGGGGMDFGGGMGSDDVKLQYVDDDVESYSNIFDNAKTDVSGSDKERLISSLKTLSEGEDIESVVNIDAVIRYFVVHNFVCNDDSYTGSMVHNYYLYEEDGVLSMIPWDYNLAFGTFSASDATETVNTPIDSPVSGGTGEDRPMISWIFSSDEYTELYHEYFAEFIETVDIAAIIDETAELIAPYVEKDPTKFYSYEDFESGVEALKEFCSLRIESVQGQLDGTIPSTSEGQSADSGALIDAGDLDLSDMGSMNSGGGFGGGGGPSEGTGEMPSFGDMGDFTPPEDGTAGIIEGTSSQDTESNAAAKSDVPTEGGTSEMPGFGGGVSQT